MIVVTERQAHEIADTIRGPAGIAVKRAAVILAAKVASDQHVLSVMATLWADVIDCELRRIADAERVVTRV